MRLFKYISTLLAAILLVVYFFNGPSSYQTYQGKIFGTFYHVKIKSPIKNKKLGKQIKHILKLTNYQMSVFEKQSELNKINNLQADKELTLSPEMTAVLYTANEIYRLSGGAFDPSIAPVVDLWGFGIKDGQSFPTDEQIKEALRHVGFKKLHFSDDFSRVEKTDSALRLNLSAIAKGFAVDRVAKLLSDLGYEDYVVEIGGEVKAAGERSFAGSGWNIGLSNPDNKGNALVLSLHNKAMATSGDYRNYFIKDGKRYAHTISPQTGYPLDDTLASVSVIDDSCMRADALATAIMALGYPEGKTFADENKIPAIFFIREKEQGKEKFSRILSKSAKTAFGE